MVDNHDFVVDNDLVIEHEEATTNEALGKYQELVKDVVREEE